MSEPNGGFDNLIARAQREISDIMSADASGGVGDSPIERLFYHAMNVYSWLCSNRWSRNPDYLVFAQTPERLEWYMNSLPSKEDAIIVASQVQLPWGRVDFVIHAWGYQANQWRKLIVECDGHAFHERTKEQAARDRSRDREATLAGYDVFRFTGAELWRDAWGCADQVYKWAAKDY